MFSRENISADLHEQILYLLPSHDLRNLRRVCRAWNELISSQRFIQEHARRRSNRALIVALSPKGITVCHDPTANQIRRRRRIRYPPGFTAGNTRIAGSFDGLLCLVRLRSTAFAIINPSTGKSDVRTTHGFLFHQRNLIWFGKHPSAGGYLIAGVAVSVESMTELFRLSSEPALRFSFPPNGHFLPEYCCDDSVPPVLLHDALHWTGYRDQEVAVLAYDIRGKKKVSGISTPFRSQYVRLGIVDGCLFAIVFTWPERFVVWIMKEYGVEESWTEYCSIEGLEGLRFEIMTVLPVGFLPDGDLILKVGYSRIVKYSISDEKGTAVPGIEEARSAVLCDDSLVSPSLIWGSCSPLLTRN